MFDYWRERRRLRREIAGIVRRNRLLSEDEKAALATVPSELAGPLIGLELLEYEMLLGKARRLVPCQVSL